VSWQIDRILVAGLLVMATVLVSACASQPSPEEPDLADDQLENTRRTARAAFDGRRYRQAAGLYQDTLNLALARDDLDAIIDARYNLAIALLNNGEYARALEVITQARAELQRAGQRPGMDLLLVDATLLYRNERLDDAWVVTDSLLSLSPPVSEEVAQSTWFLRGLMAQQRADGEALVESIQQLTGARQPLARADYQELVGYQQMAERDYDAALGSFDRASDLRSTTGDYRGMVRSLAMAGEASAAAGNNRRAADFFLRAGRSAALGGDRQARDYLRRAQTMATAAGDTETADEAGAFLEDLESESSQR